MGVMSASMDTLTGRPRESIVANAELDRSISGAVRAVSFGEALAARGMTVVALDEDGRLTGHHPDVSTTPLD